MIGSSASFQLLDSPLLDAFSFESHPAIEGGRRVCILIWGFGYFGAGRSFLVLGFQRHSILLDLLGALVFAAGARILFNAVPRAEPSSTEGTRRSSSIKIALLYF